MHVREGNGESFALDLDLRRRRCPSSDRARLYLVVARRIHLPTRAMRGAIFTTAAATRATCTGRGAGTADLRARTFGLSALQPTSVAPSSSSRPRLASTTSAPIFHVKPCS